MSDLSMFVGHYRDYNPDKAEFTTSGALISQQVRTLFDGGAVARFHTMPTLKENSVAAHSHGVAVFCMLMSDDASANMLKAALVHDLAEQYTGDVPSPSKRLLDIRSKLNEAENRLLGTVGLCYEGELSPEEARILKLADCADGMMFCARERMLGNRSKMLKQAYKNYGTYVHTLMTDMPFGTESQRVAHVFTAIAKLWKENKGE
jgi:5'-deoxynucleotidase YfbR-like HD superfamily hydrolase